MTQKNKEQKDNGERARFYGKVYWSREHIGGYHLSDSSTSFKGKLSSFIKEYKLQDKKFLEVGSGPGALQDFVGDYTGLDYAPELREHYRKPFAVVDHKNGTYPLESGVFDVIFSNATLEHIEHIETGLREMLRVLKPGGYLFIDAAWQVRPWTAEGYTVRPYRDLDLRGKLVKASILFREPIAFRALFIFPQRIIRTLKFLFWRDALERLEYKKLAANYDTFWTSDSDACNHIDPHAAIIWFLVHGCEVVNYPNLFRAFFVRSGELVIRKK